MQLEYRLLEDDYIEYNRFHFKNMPRVRVVSSVIYIMPAVIMLMLLLALPKDATGKQSLILLIGALWTFLAPAYFSSSSRRQLQRLVRSRDGTNLFGRRVLVVSPEGVTLTTDTSRHETKWKGISRVAVGEKGIYLYDSAETAYVVPNSAFNTVNTRERFLEEALRYREQAAGLIEAL